MEDKKLLRQFMLDHFPFTELRKAGFFNASMKGDYEAQAARVCTFFGYKSVYEYGAKEISCHLTFAEGRPMHVNEDGELRAEPFITVKPDYYK
jgi:hypothetical protein